jgi:hypothetical protein
MSRLLSVGALALALFACARVEHVPLPSGERPLEFSRWITFYDTPLEVHLSRPREPRPGAPLLLYATGDGGWRGPDRDVYEHMTRWGYPVAGFSALGYLKHLGWVPGTTTPERLGRDYLRLMAVARSALELPEGARTILVGVSRGAGLSIAAATEEDVRRQLAGVVAVALIREEEYVRHYRVPRHGARGDTPARELVTFDNYGSLELLASLPLAVVQSTGDSYLPAADARELFGPDSEFRHLYAIEATSHSFRGGRGALFDRMEASLQWITSVSR